MNLVFAGTPMFAQVAMARLLEAGHSLSLVLTQPDRPAGRGLKVHPSPVKLAAMAHDLPLCQPRGLRLDGKFADDALAARDALRVARPDVMVVAAYGLILPQWVLDLPLHGCLNIHASLLPRWRGAAPIHRAIEAGDAETGVTLMQMDAGLDTGDMLSMRTVPILSGDTTGTLQDRLAELGGRMVVDALDQLGALVCTMQPCEGVTYAHKIDKSEAPVDWTQAADVIERRLRAFDPFPGATSVLAGECIKIWAGRVSARMGTPGEVLAISDECITVACGVGSIELLELQRPGGKRLGVKYFLSGREVNVGQRWGPSPA